MLEISKSKNITWVKIYSILIYMGEGREGERMRRGRRKKLSNTKNTTVIYLFWGFLLSCVIILLYQNITRRFLSRFLIRSHNMKLKVGQLYQQYMESLILVKKKPTKIQYIIGIVQIIRITIILFHNLLFH